MISELRYLNERRRILERMNASGTNFYLYHTSLFNNNSSSNDDMGGTPGIDYQASHPGNACIFFIPIACLQSHHHSQRRIYLQYPYFLGFIEELVGQREVSFLKFIKLINSRAGV